MFLDGLLRFTEVSRIVTAWTSRNSLTLNTKKTKAIILGPLHTVGSIAEAETVEFVSEIKDFGAHS